MARHVPVTFVIVIGLVLGVGVWTRAEQAPRTRCSLENKGAFDPGWTENTTAGAYRCVPTFDAALKPSGAAWVRVNTDGTIGAQLPR